VDLEGFLNPLVVTRGGYLELGLTPNFGEPLVKRLKGISRKENGVQRKNSYWANFNGFIQESWHGFKRKEGKVMGG